MGIIWREQMAVDHGVIDHDHQTLIGIINAFCDMRPAGDSLPRMQDILDKLERYTAFHFEREEALQSAARYPFIEAHHHEHLELIRQLRAIREEFNAFVAVPESGGEGEAPPPANADIAKLHADIENFLHHWLVDHVVKADLRMKPYTEAMAKHAHTLKPLMHTAI